MSKAEPFIELETRLSRPGNRAAPKIAAVAAPSPDPLPVLRDRLRPGGRRSTDGRVPARRGDAAPPGQPRPDVPQADRAGRARCTPRDRATVPLLRASRDAPFAEAGWDDALGHVAGTLRRIVAEHGPDAIAFYISGQLLTEDYYAVNKLAKGFLGTNNVDSNSRLCMSSAVAGYTGRVRRRRPAAGLRRPRAGRLPAAARLEHRGVPPDRLGPDPRPPGARARR